MVNHTPGPWSVDPTRFGVKKPTINGARIVASSGLQIGSVTSVADKPIYQKEADALLFAAAPDLLATLKWLHNKGGLGLEVHDRIRLVLARAEVRRSGAHTDISSSLPTTLPDDRDQQARGEAVPTSAQPDNSTGPSKSEMAS